MQHFDLCIIGSGSGNSIVDERFAGQRVALVEGGTFGGTCVNVGCIPTKMLVHPADLARTPEHADPLGVDLELVESAGATSTTGCSAGSTRCRPAARTTGGRATP